MNLEQNLKDFIATEWPSFEHENQLDERVVLAVEGGTFSPIEREQSILKWLNYYKVLRSFPTENSKKVAAQIILFAETRLSSDPLSSAQVVSEFGRLRERIQRAAPLVPGTSNPREVTSLTSKALWCCYPKSVPMLDSYALNALRVVSRLCHIRSANAGSEYATFLDVWFELYRRLEPVIDQIIPADYPYKVRVQDRFLWHLGQPSFELSLGQTADPDM